ncbi:MAG: Hsp20/alpha crystallin family protein [Oscillospiraceae bacterium]|nr:Hsp20/alpha crystallin family protein [Oscillospiraceae bacterium]
MYGITPFEKKTFDLFNAFHNFEDDFFNGTALSSCRTDIKDEGDKYVLETELPGFEKEDIKLDLNGNNLTITAEHSNIKEETNNNGNYVRRERTYGAYQRSFDVSAVDTNNIEAEYRNGVLTLNMPKKQTEISASRRLEIK